jgi:hypothetical protein
MEWTIDGVTLTASKEGIKWCLPEYGVDFHIPVDRAKRGKTWRGRIENEPLPPEDVPPS